MHLSECAHRYSNEKKKKTLSGEVVFNVNRLTKTGIASGFVRARFHLSEGYTKLAELNVRSFKNSDTPAIYQEPSAPPPPDIPVVTATHSQLQVSAVAVPVHEEELLRIQTAPTNTEVAIPIPTIA